MVDAAVENRPAISPELMAALREAIRAELQAALPHLKEGPALLTVNEAARKYRRGYDTLRAMIRRGELMAVERRANNGGVQWMIVAAEAERVLGGVPA